jgi:hypothetical protein
MTIMWHPARLTPRQIKIRQRRAVAAVETILRGELPNALGLSALATDFFLVDDTGGHGGQVRGKTRKDMTDAPPPAPMVPELAPVKSSPFHLATTYQHQLCGESRGFLMPLSQGIMLTEVRTYPGGHPRGQWLTWYTAIRFAETCGALLGESKLVILEPPLDAAPLLECLDCEITMDERFGTHVAAKQIELNLPPAGSKELGDKDRATETAKLVKAYLGSRYQSTQWHNFQLLKPITPYQMKRIRSTIGIDAPQGSPAPFRRD